jgi:uncharacterized protein (DUF1778 family)/NTP pyrophosphatase (non-canonical NTP hydrolase)
MRQLAWCAGGDLPSGLFHATELGGEVGEVLNVVKKLEREAMGWRGSRATEQDLADECADVLICVDKLAAHYGIDLDAAVIAKFNATSEKVGLPHRLAAAPPKAEPQGCFECGAALNGPHCPVCSDRLRTGDMRWIDGILCTFNECDADGDAVWTCQPNKPQGSADTTWAAEMRRVLYMVAPRVEGSTNFNGEVQSFRHVVEVASRTFGIAQEPQGVGDRSIVLHKALMDLLFAARTSGGTDGHDEFLTRACAAAEAVLMAPMKLTPAASLAFAEALANPPEPNEALQEAASRYKQGVGDAGGALANRTTPGHPDAYLSALLDYSGGFYMAAIANGMKAGEAADAVQHIERAARGLHALASAPPAPDVAAQGAGKGKYGDAIEAYDDGSEVHLLGSNGGGHALGAWSALELGFIAADGTETRRTYTADDVASPDVAALEQIVGAEGLFAEPASGQHAREIARQALASEPDSAVDEDDIYAAINDSIDMDWTSRIGARAVMKLLREKGVLS